MRYLRVSHGTLAARVLRERREGEGDVMDPPPPRDPGCSPTPTVLTQTKRAAGRGKGEGSAGPPPFWHREVVEGTSPPPGAVWSHPTPGRCRTPGHLVQVHPQQVLAHLGPDGCQRDTREAPVRHRQGRLGPGAGLLKEGGGGNPLPPPIRRD